MMLNNNQIFVLKHKDPYPKKISQIILHVT